MLSCIVLYMTNFNQENRFLDILYRVLFPTFPKSCKKSLDPVFRPLSWCGLVSRQVLHEELHQEVIVLMRVVGIVLQRSLFRLSSSRNIRWWSLSQQSLWRQPRRCQTSGIGYVMLCACKLKLKGTCNKNYKITRLLTLAGPENKSSLAIGFAPSPTKFQQRNKREILGNLLNWPS